MESPDPRRRFDFRDNLAYEALFIHLGNRAVVACFDGGAQAMQVADVYERLVSHRLHRIQAKEFAANVFYTASLFQRVPLYQTVETPDHTWMGMVALDGVDKRGGIRVVDLGEGKVVTMPDIPKESLDTPLFRDWVQSDYAHVLSWFLGLPVRELNPTENIVVTYLWNEDETFKEITEDKA